MMRLGVIMTGAGVHAAACLGVLEELFGRHVEPYAVCGLAAGAWPAALYGAGGDIGRMREAAAQASRMGRRMMRPGVSLRALEKGNRAALCEGRGLQKLLTAQTGGRMLALCPQRAIFPVRTARGGHCLVFSTQAFAPKDGTIITTQASMSFAARAAMAVPPFLTPLEWMGSPLVPLEDAGFAARQLLAMGAQRILLIVPQPAQRRSLDALELASAARLCAAEGELLPPGAAMLRVIMPEDAGALSFSALPACYEAGKKTAERELDLIFERMGMAFCRILPFRREN